MGFMFNNNYSCFSIPGNQSNDWTSEEVSQLISITRGSCVENKINWTHVQSRFPDRTPEECKSKLQSLIIAYRKSTQHLSISPPSVFQPQSEKEASKCIKDLFFLYKKALDEGNEFDQDCLKHVIKECFLQKDFIEYYNNEKKK